MKLIINTDDFGLSKSIKTKNFLYTTWSGAYWTKKLKKHSFYNEYKLSEFSNL